MKTILTAVAAALACTEIFAAQKPLTLAEKIAMARQMADEAAQGKAQVGRIVENNFDFAAEVKKFRIAQKASMTVPEPEEEEIEQAPRELTAANPKPASKPVAKKEIKTISDDDEIDKFARDIKTRQKKEKPAAQTASDIHEAAFAEAPAKRTVDTPNFVNGHFIGTLGADSSETKSVKKIHEKLDKLDESDKHDTLIFNGSMFSSVCNDKDVHHVFAMPLVRACENVFSEYFAGENSSKLSFNDKILLTFSVAKKDDGNGKIVCSTSAKGSSTIFVKWSKNLKFDEFCAKISQTVLEKMATGYAGKKARAPRWLELAMAQAYECETVFGASAQSAQICADNPPKSDKSVFAIPSDAPDTPVARAQCYWTLASAAKVLHSRKKLSEFLKAAFDGKSPDELSAKLSTLGRSKKSPLYEPLELWWPCVITGEIWARLGGVFSSERSESELLRLAVLQVDADNGTKRVGLNGRQIFKNREVVAEEIGLRVVEIKVALPKINPLYYNALVSLGKTFEAARDNDSDAFEKSLSDFVSELSLARSRASEAEKMLNKKN